MVPIHEVNRLESGSTIWVFRTAVNQVWVLLRKHVPKRGHTGVILQSGHEERFRSP